MGSFLTLLGTAPAAGVPVVPPSSLLTSLVSHWTLDEASGTRVDSVVASGNDLTDNNTVTQAAGKVGNAAQFTAANTERLSRADNASLSVSGQAFEFGLDVYPDTLPSYAILASKDENSGAGTREWACFVESNGAVTFAVYDAAGGSQVATTAAGVLVAGVWSRVQMWHDLADSKPRLQINDGTIYVASTAVTSSDSTGTFYLGVRGATGLPWNGRQDEAAFWKGRVLTTAERTALQAAITYPFTGILTS